MIQPITPQRLRHVKRAFTTRRVDLKRAAALLDGEPSPRPGDLVLARVLEIGQHARLQLAQRRAAALFVGDEILLAYGHRYAPDQFEAEVPDDLGICHLVAGGGLAARVLSFHTAMDPPTLLQPLGLLADAAGRRINLLDHALPGCSPASPLPTLAVVGSAMNAGKTTTAAHLVHGLARAGHRVGAAKVTGTGAFGDYNALADAGAEWVLDFTDAGHPSTYKLDPGQLEQVFQTLTGTLARRGADVLVLEVADGLYQRETGMLLQSALFRNRVDGLLMAAHDALGASAGSQWLRARQLPLLGLAGTLTCSALASREAAAATGLPVYDLERLVSEAPRLCPSQPTLRAAS